MKSKASIVFASYLLVYLGVPVVAAEVYHQDRVVTEHVRSYDRYQDFEKPEHVEELLAQRRQARQQQMLTRFLALSPKAREYYQRLEEKRGNARHHAQKIVALSEIYGVEKCPRPGRRLGLSSLQLRIHRQHLGATRTSP
jgi:GrpB-like predicted nucleotidyltransferase (UPF0157 family)